MTKQAHIVSTPDAVVGDPVIALCGKEFTLTELMADIPKDKPIHRRCVLLAVEAMTEADGVIETARIHAAMVAARLERMIEALTVSTRLDEFADERLDFEAAIRDEQEAEEAEERAKTTCICSWTDAETRVTNPDCPIHGDKDDVPVAPEEEG